jgi:hypothetical protein
MEKRVVKRNRSATRIPETVTALPAGYLAMLGEFPLRPIKSATRPH